MSYPNFTPSPPSQSTALLDSVCTEHFILANAKFTNKLLAETHLEVCLPNGSTIATTHTATLNLLALPHSARQAHILPGLAQHSLLSVGQMCDNGCAIKFTATKVTVTNAASTILTGKGEKESGLWRAPLETSIPLQIAPEHYAQNVYEQKSIQDTITYMLMNLI
jgi:hypothetical protein